MIARILAAALVAAATPLAAGAQTCPTNADLHSGIRLTRIDPFFSIVQTQTPTGLTEARVTQREGMLQSVSSIYSHPMTVTQRDSNSGTLTLDYGSDVADIDRINRTSTWTSTVTLGSGGRPLNTGNVTITFLGANTFEIGACSYDIWILRENLTLNGRTPIIAEKTYAPDLGLVLSTIQMNPDGSARSGVFFDEIAAE
jgi:hypothetical protein